MEYIVGWGGAKFHRLGQQGLCPLEGHFAEAYKLYPEHGPKAFLKSWKKAERTDILVDAFVRMVACKLLGDRFRTVMPSDMKFPGAFANKSIVVKGPKAGSWDEVWQDHQPPNKQYTAMKNMSERFGLEDISGRYVQFHAAH
ncbi:hypothetical protein BSKO_13497 [Bryopsis sp. KO-2023]|nr:hypothetical protein BSKO_13497 [Bryopsis sp. KO-2023]